MSLMSKRGQIINYLKGWQVITLKEACTLGINAMMLTRAVKEGWLHRLGKAVYSDNPDLPFDPVKKFLPVVAKYPEAILTSISALSLHGLTDEEEREIWIALPHNKKVQGQKGIKVLRLSGPAYSLGIQTLEIGKREVRFYDREKSVVDAFKYLTEEIAIKALKAYLQKPKINVTKLLDYGKRLGRPLHEEVKTIMTV